MRAIILFLERICAREYPIVGGYGKIFILHRLYHVTAYDWDFPVTKFLQEDKYANMCTERSIGLYSIVFTVYSNSKNYTSQYYAVLTLGIQF